MTEAAAEPAGWPILVTQAGKHGNREVMLPANLGRDLTQSVLAGLVTDDDGQSPLRAVPVDAGNGAMFTVVSRRVRATSDCAAKVINLRNNQRLGELTGHTGLISGVSLNRTGLVAATCGWDFTLRTWDTPTGRPIAMVTEPASRFSGCCLDPDGRLVAAAGFDGTVGVYDVRTGETLARQQLPVNLPGAIAFNATATVLFAGAQDGTIQRVRRKRSKLPPLEGHEGPVTALALNSTGRLLASAGRDGTTAIWDLKPSRMVMRLSAHTGGVTACAFVGGAQLVTAGWDGAVRLWDLSERTSRTIWQDRSAIRAVAVTATLGIAVSSHSGVVMAVDPAGRTDPAVLSIGEGHIDALAGAARAPVLLTGSMNDVPDGTPVRDGFGRPATFTEGILVPLATLQRGVPPTVWERVHAEALTAMGIVSSDPSGRTIVAAPRVPLV